MGLALGQLALAFLHLGSCLGQLPALCVQGLLVGRHLGHAGGVLVGHEGIATRLGLGCQGIDLRRLPVELGQLGLEPGLSAVELLLLLGGQPGGGQLGVDGLNEAGDLCNALSALLLRFLGLGYSMVGLGLAALQLLAGTIKLGLSLVDGLLPLVGLLPALGHLAGGGLVLLLLSSQLSRAQVHLLLPLIDGRLGLHRLGGQLVLGGLDALGALVQIPPGLVQLLPVPFEFRSGLVHLVLPLVQLLLQGGLDGVQPRCGAA